MDEKRSDRHESLSLGKALRQGRKDPIRDLQGGGFEPAASIEGPLEGDSSARAERDEATTTKGTATTFSGSTRNAISRAQGRWRTRVQRRPPLQKATPSLEHHAGHLSLCRGVEERFRDLSGLCGELWIRMHRSQCQGGCHRETKKQRPSQCGGHARALSSFVCPLEGAPRRDWDRKRGLLPQGTGRIRKEPGRLSRDRPRSPARGLWEEAGQGAFSRQRQQLRQCQSQ
mmetsp:Transcript_5606/g.11894  ORF Transcript_5606/g.11894 Transcript_5606/m.11894 type:complete len:229 (-) Transcript_5606:926-1612(-)